MSEDVPPLHCRLIAFPVGRNRGEGSAVQRVSGNEIFLCGLFLELLLCGWAKWQFFVGPLGGWVPAQRLEWRVAPFCPERAGFFPGGMPPWAETN